MAAIERADDLGSEQKRHWLTSLRQMGRYLDRPLSLIPSRIAAIREAVIKLHPTRLGVNTKTFINHRANARAALSGSISRRPIRGARRRWIPATALSWIG
jgi:hypothetical protein